MIDPRSGSYGVALLRIVVGVYFIAHAGLKLIVFTPAGTEHFFASLGLPGWFGLVIITVELLAGVCLILGVYSRVAAVLIAPDLIGAIVLVHIHNGFFFTDRGGGWEFPALWFAALIAIALIGDGAWTLWPRRRPAVLDASPHSAWRNA